MVSRENMPTAINTQIYDRIVQHLADTRLYEAETSTNVSRGIRRHQKRLKSLLSKNIKADVRTEVVRSTKELHMIVSNSVADYADASTSFHANNLERSAGSFFKVQKPKGSDAIPKLIGPNITASKSLKDHFDSIGTIELARIDGKIKSGLADGKSPKAIIDDVIRTTSVTEVQAKALVRTAITNTQSTAMSLVMSRNEELLVGYRFTAVLDNRTSPICAHHDGEVYKLNDMRFRPPLHWNCRSSMIPILKNKTQLLAGLDNKDTRLKPNKLKETPDKLLDGSLPPVETYSTWLKRQPMQVQVSHLGSEEKAGLLQKGILDVKSFTTSKGQQLSIAALRRLDNARTFLYPTRQAIVDAKEAELLFVQASRPYDLTRSPELTNKLKVMYIADAENAAQSLSLTDFRGTTLQGKRSVRIRANNEFDERNTSFDPFTGEQSSTLLYDPDFNVLQERLDFIKNSKSLNQDQKEWIQNFVASMEESVSINQQTAIAENLRVVFERYNNDKQPWVNFMNVVRGEMQYSVVNTSRILDRRSRARSMQFDSYGVAGEPAKVQIFGKYYSFKDVQDSALDNDRYIRSWETRYGRSIARGLLYTGRTPLYTWFKGPIGRDRVSFKKRIEKIIREDIPGGALWLDRNKVEPTESMIQKFLRGTREEYRKIVDLEFLFQRNKKNYIDELIEEKVGGKEAISVITKAIGLVADGKSTDYDSLAINIGRMLRQEYKLTEKHEFPFFKPTLKDYHADGSQILTALRDKGYIRVVKRGKTRRSVVDLETGRASGPWKDTISREVQILDNNMLNLQRANRSNLISQRIGIVEDRDRLYVRPGQKNYFDARGNNTGIPIITRRANANYDKLLIDRDFADMLNHTMSVKYEVDNEFSAFMDDVVRFRDPRGNVKKYDDLNDFRKLILTRGDQGYSFMQTVKYHRDNGKPFSVIANIDGRGRVYYQGYLTPTGGEVVRPFINTSKAENLSVEAFQELMIQTGAMIGPATEALTQAGRMEIFLRNEKDILSLGRLMMETTQRDRRIREYLEHPLIRSMDAEEIAKISRLAIEYARIHKHVNGDFTNVNKLTSYKTKLMIENDASSSGAQIIGLSTKDRSIAINSNVLPTDQKNRLYDLVAMDTISDPEFQKITALRDANIQWTDLQKAAKAQNMVSFYGAGKATQAANIEAKFASVLEEKGYTVVTREELRGVTNIIDKSIKDAEYLGADNTVFGLKQLKRELNEVVEGESPVGNELLQHARDSHPDVEAFVDKLMNARGGLVGPQDFKAVSEIMSRKLAERAPVTQKFVQFWKEAAKAYVDETQKVDIPWVTFDGKTLYQRYRPKVQTSIEFYDKEANRMVRNIYEDKAEDATLLGKASLMRAGIGMGVNGNHMNDASIVRQFHLWGRKNNVETATIHDAFFTNIGLAAKSKGALREIYADALDGNTIEETLKALKREGLSDKTYRELRQKAIQDGLIDPPNKITRKDILAPIPKGKDWYGIGP
jgi:SPP1 gp7 family putative phage head morphogenesis protein